MKILLRFVALMFLITGLEGSSQIPVPPPPLPMPEGDWEVLAGQYELIAVLDEVIESKLAFVISEENNPHYLIDHDPDEQFVHSSVFRVTATFSRFLKIPEEVKLYLEGSDKKLSFYVRGNVVFSENLTVSPVDDLQSPNRLPRRGEILLIQSSHPPWSEGYSIAPYLHDTVDGDREHDLAEGILTWCKKEETWKRQWEQMKESSNNPVQETPAKAADPDL
jgi:hypothetical protein